MKKTAAHKVDFFSLQVFCAVYEQRSFSRAAEILAINQSVVSYTIDRLRGVLDDPLFVRQGGGIAPTDRCNEVSGDIRNLLERFETMVDPKVVVPSEIDATFRVSCNFYERNLIMPRVFKSLHSKAPKARMEVVQAGTQGTEHLAHGLADLLIGPMVPDGETFYCRSLLQDSYVCVMDKANPLATAPLTLDRFLAANRVEVSYGEDWTSEYLAVLEPMLGGAARSLIKVPSPSDVQNIVLGSDLIATIPSLYAETLSSSVHIAAFPRDAHLRIGLVWSKRTHSSATHKWFRDLVVDAAGSLLKASGNSPV